MFLSAEEKAALEKAHRFEKDKRVADRIKVVLLKSEGWSNTIIAQALRICESTVRLHEDDYALEKKLKPENGGSKPLLNEEQTKELKAHLVEHTYIYAKCPCKRKI